MITDSPACTRRMDVGGLVRHSKRLSSSLSHLILNLNRMWCRFRPCVTNLVAAGILSLNGYADP